MKFAFLAFLLFLLLVSACSPQPIQPTPTPTPAPTLVPTLTPPPARLPATEAEVRRVSLQDARAAFDNGTAIIVDVRSPQAFAMSHVSGAVSIPLADIEANPRGLALPKDKWIITYCT